jgi:hypothetical protein
MLQMMAEKDQPAPSQPQPETPAAFANSRGRSTSTSFVNTLGEIVGLGPLMKKAPAGDKGDRAAVASRGATGEEGVRSTGTEPSASSAAKSAEFVDRVGGAEKSESEGTRAETAHDSLVSKRLAVALANRAEENAGRPSDIGAPRTQPSPNPSISPPLSTTADRFITMVIEFAIPESKPPARTNAGRTRS